MSMDANGHIMLCDNGDIRASLVQNLAGDSEEAIDLRYKDISTSPISCHLNDSWAAASCSHSR